MKKIIIIAICLLLLCACSNEPKPTEPATTTTPVTTTQPMNETTPSTQEPTTEPGEDAFSLAESCIGKSVDELIALIGEPESSDYAQSCLVEGAQDGNWYYDGFTVYTLKTADGETVEYVE
jgi:hypothetical protein